MKEKGKANRKIGKENSHQENQMYNKAENQTCIKIKRQKSCKSITFTINNEGIRM